MFVRLSLAAGLIAATVVVQALFMSAGLNTFKRIEEHRPGAMASKPATTELGLTLCETCRSSSFLDWRF
jgi:hypothetical protein